MAGKVLNIKGRSHLKWYYGLTGKYYVFGHYSYILLLELIVNEDISQY